MIEIYKTLNNAERLTKWMDQFIRPAMTEDPSSYAKGRLIAWLDKRPTFGKDWVVKPGVTVPDNVIPKLKEWIEWDFDFCLVTYSGEGDSGNGILPHRDSSYADYEARGLHLSGEAKFDYWNSRQSFGFSQDTGISPKTSDPTHSLILKPGEVMKFNCKNVHSADPGPNRWGLNFWKQKR